jgi:heme/copper-type cytochrome/quinol oxidase subunit 2
MKKEKGNKPKELKFPLKSLYALGVAILGTSVWISIGQYTKYGLQIKLPESYIPTLINGITTSTSVVIGIFIAVLGIMLRHSIEKKDSGAKQFYLLGMVILMIPVVWLWTTYVFLVQGFYTFAVTYSLDALILALFVLISIIVFTAVRISNQTEKEDPTIGDDM